MVKKVSEKDEKDFISLGISRIFVLQILKLFNKKNYQTKLNFGKLIYIQKIYFLSNAFIIFISNFEPFFIIRSRNISKSSQKNHDY